MTEQELILLMRKKDGAEQLYDACVLALEALNAVPVPPECRPIVRAAGKALIEAILNVGGDLE